MRFIDRVYPDIQDMCDDNKNNPGGLRLNKALAAAGAASRRGADELVANGRVLVNGKAPESPGARLLPGDVLLLDGKPVDWDRADDAQEYCYLMLNKPVQVVSTARDPQGRKTVLDLLPGEYRGKRLYPVGRLDFFSEGLIILTDDGELTNRMTHPRYHLPKVYEVLIRGGLSAEAQKTMESGMRLAEGEKLAPVRVKRISRAKPGELIGLTLHQGVNRQIRRMCRDLGLTILFLRRVEQGPLKLGDLPKGRCRPLAASELAELRKALKM